MNDRQIPTNSRLVGCSYLSDRLSSFRCLLTYLDVARFKTLSWELGRFRS